MGNVKIKLKELMAKEQAAGNHLTQMILANEIGVAQGTLSRWIGNRITMVDLDVLDKLCDRFQVEPGDILVREREG